MEPTRRSARATTSIAILALLLSACSGYVRHGSAEPIATIRPTTYGAGVKLPPMASYDDFTAKRKGLLHIQLLDERNIGVAGAYIRYAGPQKGRVATNAKGFADVLIAPGTYKVDVAPCGPSVVTNDYQSAIASVVAGGQPSQGRLTGIRWQRRYHPVPSVVYSQDPPWKIGSSVRAAIRVEDRCPDAYGAAADVGLPTYHWTISDNFRLNARPLMRSDAEGSIHVAFRCVARGNGGVVISDPKAPGDGPLNILEAGAGPGSGHAFCER